MSKQGDCDTFCPLFLPSVGSSSLKGLALNFLVQEEKEGLEKNFSLFVLDDVSTLRSISKGLLYLYPLPLVLPASSSWPFILDQLHYMVER